MNKNKKFTTYHIKLVFILFPGLLFSSLFAQNAKQNLELGNKAYQLEDYHQAIFYYQKSVALNQSYKPALTKLAWSYFYNQAYRLSKKTFKKILKLNAANTEALLGLAEIERKNLNYSSALEYLEKAGKSDPYNLNVKLLKAAVYEDAGKIRLAELKFKNILKSNPEFYKALLGLSRVYNTKKKFNKALALVDKAIKIQPQNWRAFVHRGRILLNKYFSTKDEDTKSDFLVEAKTAFFTSHSIKDNLVESNLILARLNFAEKKYESALAFMEKSISLNTRNAHFVSFKAEVLGQMLKSSGNISMRDKVISAYKKALKLDPFDDISRYSYENLLLRYIEKGMHPYRLEAARYHYKRAKQNFKENKNRSALLELKRSIKLYPGFIPARVSYLNYLYYSGDMEAYIHGLKYLRRSFPKEARYYNALEWALSKQHKLMYYKADLYRQSDGDYNYRRSSVKVFTFSLNASELFPLHPSAGKIISENINTALNNLGRLSSYSVEERKKIFGIMSNYIPEKEFSFSTTKTIFYPEVIKVFFSNIPEVKRPDYLLYGDYKQGLNSIQGNFIVYHLKKGVVISKFSLNASGEGALNDIALRVSRRLYNLLPYEGLLIKKTGNYVYINLGLRDGVKKNSVFSLLHSGVPYARLEVVETSERISKALVYQTKSPKNKKLKYPLSKVRLYDTIIPLAGTPKSNNKPK